MEHPDRRKCVCQGRGRYFVAKEHVLAMRWDDGLALDIPVIDDREVYCSLHGITDADAVQSRALGIYVVPSF